MFGLSANPPTGDTGHVGIVRSLVASSQFVEIWVMPVYVHIYEAKRNLVSYEHRMEMCRLAMEGESTATCTVKVTDTEKDVYEWCCKNRENRNTVVRVGSIDVLSHIQRKHPDIDLHLVLGADTFTDLAAGKWKDSNRSHSLCSSPHKYRINALHVEFLSSLLFMSFLASADRPSNRINLFD